MGSVQDCDSRIKDLTSETKKQLQDTSKLQKKIDIMSEEMSLLKEEVERLEAFSRRDNLRLFGVPEKDNGDYQSCAESVCEALNRVEGPKEWTSDDIVRAHRIGKARDGGPRPMIAKFASWKDKMAILGNHSYRDKLQEKGVRVSNDLTKTQARQAAEARRNGKVAYFKGGKLVVKPRDPDNRTYAEVVSTDTPAKENITQWATQQATRLSVTSPPRPIHGDSPSRVTDPVSNQCNTSQRSPARDSRDIRHYYGSRVERPSPGKSGPRQQQPRRSERSNPARR